MVDRLNNIVEQKLSGSARMVCHLCSFGLIRFVSELPRLVFECFVEIVTWMQPQASLLTFQNLLRLEWVYMPSMLQDI